MHKEVRQNHRRQLGIGKVHVSYRSIPQLQNAYHTKRRYTTHAHTLTRTYTHTHLDAPTHIHTHTHLNTHLHTHTHTPLIVFGLTLLSIEKYSFIYMIGHWCLEW